MNTATVAARIDEESLSDGMKNLLDTATTDYDMFWAALTPRDRELTETLTHSETYDAVFIDSGYVYGFWKNDMVNSFEVWCLGHESELKVYVNEENTNLSEEALDVFIAELANDLQGLEVVNGQRTGLTYEMEYLEQNEYVMEAWTNAMETACALSAGYV
jgi:hypothetical protein